MHQNLKCKIILFFLLISYNGVAKDLPIELVRERIEQAALNIEKNEELIDDLKSLKEPSALHLAFLATANALMCTHVHNPVKRIKYAKESVELVDYAVSLDANNMEIRFIRFAIQSNLPKLLGLSKNIEEDKLFLIKHFKKQHFQSIPYRSLEEMIHVMEESNEFSDNELLTMRAEVYSLAP